ncbi:MAG TPA: GGDEF domain-containing protein, partial [Acidobacteriota bacterium]
MLGLLHSNTVDLDKTAAQWLEAVTAMMGLFYEASLPRHQPESAESTRKMDALEIRSALAAETERKLQEQESRNLKAALEAAQKEVDETRKTAVQLALLKEEHVREISREREEWLTLQLLFRSLAEKAAQAAEPADFCAAVHQLLKRLMPAANFSVVLLEGDKFSLPYLSDQLNSEPADWLAAHKTFVDQVLSDEEPLLSAFPIDGKVHQEIFNWLGAPLTVSKEKWGVAAIWDPNARYSVREKEIMQFIAWEIDGVLQRKNTEEEYRSQTPWDEATLLPKSRLFPLLMSHHLSHARRNREIIAVLILEIGQLEETRIWLDLPNGDLVLKQISDRLMQKMREGDIVVRLGEACFLWSLPGFHKVEDIAAVAEKILADVAV